MDWTIILNYILGGTSVLGVVGAAIYYRENKKLKQNEVAVSDVDKQRQEIELAEMYKDKMLEMLEQVSSKQDSGNHNQARIFDKLDALDGRMDTMDGKMADIVTYLNGDFQAYLERAHAKPRKPKKHISNGDNS